jgi:hypothetical protein
MNFPCFFALSLEINLLIAVSLLAWRALGLSLPRPSQNLRLGYLLLSMSGLLPLLIRPLHRRIFYEAPVQIWSGAQGEFRHWQAPLQSPSISFAIPHRALSGWSSLSGFEFWIAALLIAGALIAFARSLTALVKLNCLIRRTHPIRKIGRVRISVSDEAATAFSFRNFGAAHVVLTPEMVLKPSSLKIAVLHELQHHRQGDTLWVHAIQLLKMICFWNPFLLLWEKELSQTQEFACDEALVDLKSVSPHAYGSCLLEAALNCRNTHRLLVGTTRMAVSSSGEQLKRRIDKMFSYSFFTQTPAHPKRWRGFLAGTTAVLLLVTTAFASQGLVADRRISMAEAQKLATHTQSTFPIVVNEAVLNQLNRYLGTPEGRAFMSSALERSKQYRSMIEAKMKKYHAPAELFAVPIIESGYKNYTNKIGAAGIWMFIPGTARNYDLRVDGQHDDRLNAERETEAAMKYLTANYALFSDWQLALLAYNTGESQVAKGIQATGSHDAWKLIQAHFDNDQNYLASFMAATLILKNPTLLD